MFWGFAGTVRWSHGVDGTAQMDCDITLGKSCDNQSARRERLLATRADAVAANDGGLGNDATDSSGADDGGADGAACSGSVATMTSRGGRGSCVCRRKRCRRGQRWQRDDAARTAPTSRSAVGTRPAGPPIEATAGVLYRGVRGSKSDATINRRMERRSAAHCDWRERLRVLSRSRENSNSVAACGVPHRKGGIVSGLGV